MKSAAQFLPFFARGRSPRSGVRQLDPLAGSPEVALKIQALQQFYGDRMEEISYYRSGGRSIILLGKDRQSRSLVVLKCPIDMLGREHLRLEAQALQAVQCENVIACRADHCNVSPPHLMLDYFEGSSLEDLLQDSLLKQRLATSGNMTFLIAECSRAITEMHRKGWLWGDGSLGNVLVKMQGHRVAKVCLCDLGATGQNIPGTIYPDRLLRTATYASPNRQPGNPVRPEDDFFALGKVMWEVATGCRPMGSGTMPDINRIQDPAIREMILCLLEGQAPQLRSAVAPSSARTEKFRKVLGISLLLVLAATGILLLASRFHSGVSKAVVRPSGKPTKIAPQSAFVTPGHAGNGVLKRSEPALSTPTVAAATLPPPKRLQTHEPPPPAPFSAAPQIVIHLQGARYCEVGSRSIKPRRDAANGHAITLTLRGKAIKDASIQCLDEGMEHPEIPGNHLKRGPFRWGWYVYGPKFAITLNYRFAGSSHLMRVKKVYRIL